MFGKLIGASMMIVVIGTLGWSEIVADLTNPYPYRYPTTIQLKDSVKVMNETMTIGDLALINSDIPGLAERIAETPVGNAPAVNRQRTYYLSRIKAVLNSRQIDIERIYFCGPEAVVARHVTQTLSGTRILADCIDSVIAEMGGSRSEVWVAPKRDIADEELPDGVVTTQFEVLDTNQNGETRVKATFMVDNTPAQVRYYLLETGVWRNVLVAKQSLRRGQSILASDVKVERTLLAHTQTGYFDNPIDVIGKTARVAIGSEEPLTSEQIDDPPMIVRNAPVTILIQYGSVSIRIPGQAQEEGRVGDTIRVRKNSNRKTVNAQVQGPGLVVVQ